MPRYKNPQWQKLYDNMLFLAGDKSSEMYHEGEPRRGAGHRAAFWDGWFQWEVRLHRAEAFCASYSGNHVGGVFHGGPGVCPPREEGSKGYRKECRCWLKTIWPRCGGNSTRPSR